MCLTELPDLTFPWNPGSCYISLSKTTGYANWEVCLVKNIILMHGTCTVYIYGTVSSKIGLVGL